MTNNNITKKNKEKRQNFLATFKGYKSYDEKIISIELENIINAEEHLVQKHTIIQLSEPKHLHILGELIIDQIIYFSAELLPNKILEEEHIFVDVEFDFEENSKNRELISLFHLNKNRED